MTNVRPAELLHNQRAPESIRWPRRVAAGAFLILVTYIGVMHAATRDTRDTRQLIRQTLAERGEDDPENENENLFKVATLTNKGLYLNYASQILANGI